MRLIDVTCMYRQQLQYCSHHVRLSACIQLVLECEPVTTVCCSVLLVIMSVTVPAGDACISRDQHPCQAASCWCSSVLHTLCSCHSPRHLTIAANLHLHQARHPQSLCPQNCQSVTADSHPPLVPFLLCNITLCFPEQCCQGHIRFHW